MSIIKAQGQYDNVRDQLRSHVFATKRHCNNNCRQCEVLSDQLRVASNNLSNKEESI